MSSTRRTRCGVSAAAIVLLAIASLQPAAAQSDSSDTPSIQEKTEGMQRIDGFIPLYWDEGAGKLWMEIGRFDEEILHYVSLPAGVGSNDIGLDRGQLGPRHVVEFRRVGPRVLMVQPNYEYRAVTSNPLEQKAVDDAFAESVLFGFQVSAESDGRVLVDATDFVLSDAHGVAESLRRSNQGTFRLDKARSALYLDRTRGFPMNTEIEVTLTFAGERPGAWVRSVTPTPSAVTVRQHHSFVQLPELGEYQVRAHDPRAGYGGISYLDYAAPLGEPMERRFISRHRLEKQDPDAEVSDPVEPIVYYLDPGTPEPVRSALLEGAAWWNQAFEAAGYRDAFRVRMLPDDADPMDLRYNVIQWIHRSTRGWSYGSSVSDPRTGEILKGHVSLGSLRVRQDYLIAEGLLSPYVQGDEQSAEVEAMALARIRQLSAHEVGHTLGLSHNYISSAQGRASVMDYPHPLVGLDEGGEIDLSDAYDTGIGAWDKVTITYGYQDFPQGTDEARALDAIIAEARSEGITFITDQDARPAGSAHPQVHLWDNGTDAAAELDRMMEVRRVALDRFGEEAIRSGMPMATMEEALVPLYLHHRYQVEAAIKVVGGLEYTYALRGDGQRPLRPVPSETQARALASVIATLDPEALAVPEAVLSSLPPRPAGFSPHRELFPRYTGLVFDAVTPSVVASGTVLGFLLHPERAARLVQQHARDEDQMGLTQVFHELFQRFEAEPASGYHAEINRATQGVIVAAVMGLATGASMPQVRAEANLALYGLYEALMGRMEQASSADRAHYLMIVEEIARMKDRPLEPRPAPGYPDAPPGSPIGSEAMDWTTLSCSFTPLTWW